MEQAKNVSAFLRSACNELYKPKEVLGMFDDSKRSHIKPFLFCSTSTSVPSVKCVRILVSDLDGPSCVEGDGSSRHFLSYACYH
jgi:hypothetical protein